MFLPCATDFIVAGAMIHEDLEAIDELVMDAMCENNIPHGAVSIVTKDGRLAYAKAFTNVSWLQENDPASVSEVVTPLSRFRAMSVTTTFTSMAILQQLQDQLSGPDGTQIGLYDRVFYDTRWCRWSYNSTGTTFREMAELWDYLFTAFGGERRFSQVELIHLLTHTAGWCCGDNGQGEDFEVYQTL